MTDTAAAAPPYLEIAGLSKRFDSFQAVQSVSLALTKGERLALLGPSGCGKTTILNMIAGFLPESAGAIRIGGRDMRGIPPHRRNIGVVFQNYALFPHLTIAGNIHFGLKMRGIGKAAAAEPIRQALRLVRLDQLGERYPHQLSGGQQQRAAIARAIAIRPELLLLDEPLSNLDAKLRDEMRTDLLEILGDLSITTILVTHDQAEALSLADRVAVLNQGRLEQLAAPAEAYENPATPFVASFLGESNRYAGRVEASGPDGIRVALEGGTLRSSRSGAGLAPGDEVLLFIRAERLRIAPALEAENRLEGRLRHIVYLGGEQRFVVDTALGPATAIRHAESGAGFREGDMVQLGCAAADVIVLPRA